MTNLIEIVRQDVFAFLESYNELLFNERDFQMHLATWLRNSANHYEDVDVEYYVPKTHGQVICGMFMYTVSDAADGLQR